MTIKEVSNKYDLTPDTLRYYEKIVLIDAVPRNKSGIRNYGNKELQRIEFIKCMRASGVEIEVLIKYLKYMEKGKTTVHLRKELLEEQRRKLELKEKSIQDTMTKLDVKIKLYEEIENVKRKDFSEE